MNYQNRVLSQTSRIAPIVQVPTFGTRRRRRSADRVHQAWNTIAKIVWRTLPENRSDALDVAYAVSQLLPESHRDRAGFKKLANALCVANLRARRWSRQDEARKIARPPAEVLFKHLAESEMDSDTRKEGFRALIQIQNPHSRKTNSTRVNTAPRWIQN